MNALAHRPLVTRPVGRRPQACLPPVDPSSCHLNTSCKGLLHPQVLLHLGFKCHLQECRRGNIRIWYIPSANIECSA